MFFSRCLPVLSTLKSMTVGMGAPTLPVSTRLMSMKTRMRGSLPSNMFIDSPGGLLANPDEHIPEVGINPLTWKDSAKFKLQQSQMRKKIFIDIAAAEGKKEEEADFQVTCVELYRTWCAARYQGHKNDLKRVTTRPFGEHLLMSKEFLTLTQYLQQHPQAAVEWSIANLKHEIIFAISAELGTLRAPLTFAQITVEFHSDQSILLRPNKDTDPARKPPKHVHDRIVFERCTTRKASAWKIAASLPERVAKTTPPPTPV
jgi:hypothetical protein